MVTISSGSRPGGGFSKSRWSSCCTAGGGRAFTRAWTKEQYANESTHKIVKEGCENKPNRTLVCLEGAAACFAQSQQPCLFPVVTCTAFERCIELRALLPWHVWCFHAECAFLASAPGHAVLLQPQTPQSVKIKPIKIVSFRI